MDPGEPVTDARASLVIATRNRRDLVAGALRSALDQSVPLEIIVVDDASADGTVDALTREFPDVRVLRNERSIGCAPARNVGLEAAAHPIVFFLDDDAVFSSSSTVEQTLSEMDEPRVGVVCVPLANQRQDKGVEYRAPSPDGVHLSAAYSGGACAVRRSAFVALGGYRSIYVQQNEEADLAVRLLDMGYVIRLGRADPIVHFEMRAGTDLRRRHFYAARNEIVFAGLNVPHPYLVGRLAKATLRALIFPTRAGYATAGIRGLAAGYAVLLARRGDRRPVSRRAYSLSRRLRRGRPSRLDAVEAMLPANRLS